VKKSRVRERRVWQGDEGSGKMDGVGSEINRAQQAICLR
jgi:hypothetical protein